jgi:hypothetical protein
MRDDHDRPATPASVTPSSRTLIMAECMSIQALLLQKNARYGNSALAPLRLFSTVDPIEGIKIRIDDKLSRLRALAPGETEDVELDLIGYLILLRVARRMQEGER